MSGNSTLVNFITKTCLYNYDPLKDRMWGTGCAGGGEGLGLVPSIDNILPVQVKV